MRKFAYISFFIASLFPVFAHADDAEGTITAIDQNTDTIFLDNGISYKLPGEFDYSVLNMGMKVIVFYDAQGDNRYITDIEPQDS
ncbi:DUF1344 domain-containing protein [Bartonella tamiae]|uniref:DUF1344 domain-containing protein n=1 Tax=Bartonella tamiae Th239 TaxID=1094558 RepID=J0R4E4_9HYPH|nr:DUF1344 domain-containing protein [Bartonella tamiae]EJF90519.1 hypothetical protein ME5_00920 [Bartonella tamiae Th239]EJF93537.1 hypothetical protein MEG_00961 [Bartonella tamiae Th307]